MTTRQKRTLVNRMLALQDRARALYQKKDEALGFLIAACAPGEIIRTEHGQFTIHDNFAARNVGYRPASFHRFELKEVKLPRIVAEKKETAPVRLEGEVAA